VVNSAQSSTSSIESSTDAGQRENGQDSYWGMGIHIGWITALYFALAALIDVLTVPAFRFSFLSWPVAAVISSVMLVTGIALYLFVTTQLIRGRSRHELITTGPYRIVRHPLYAIGLFLLCPGVCVLFRSWLVLTTPIIMAMVMHRLLPVEERKLIEQFGDEYRGYQEKVPMVWPL